MDVGVLDDSVAWECDCSGGNQGDKGRRALPSTFEHSTWRMMPPSASELAIHCCSGIMREAINC